MNTPDWPKEINQFIHGMKATESVLAQELESLRVKREQMMRDRLELEQFLYNVEKRYAKKNDSKPIN